MSILFRAADSIEKNAMDLAPLPGKAEKSPYSEEPRRVARRMSSRIEQKDNSIVGGVLTESLYLVN